MLAASVLHPSDGLGIQICFYRRLWGASCPGCGLSRALSSISHGEWAKAWAYHPFAIGFYAMFMIMAAPLVAPEPWRRRARQWIDTHNAPLAALYWAYIWGFIVFGFGRMLSEFGVHS